MSSTLIKLADFNAANLVVKATEPFQTATGKQKDPLVFAYDINYKYPSGSLGPLNILVSLPTRWGVSEYVDTQAAARAPRSVSIDLQVEDPAVSQQVLRVNRAIFDAVYDAMLAKYSKSPSDKAHLKETRDTIYAHHFSNLLKEKDPSEYDIKAGRNAPTKFLRAKLKHYYPKNPASDIEEMEGVFPCKITSTANNQVYPVSALAAKGVKIMWNAKVLAVLTVVKTFQAIAPKFDANKFCMGVPHSWGISLLAKELRFKPSVFEKEDFGLENCDPDFVTEVSLPARDLECDKRLDLSNGVTEATALIDGDSE